MVTAVVFVVLATVIIDVFVIFIVLVMVIIVVFDVVIVLDNVVIAVVVTTVLVFVVVTVNVILPYQGRGGPPPSPWVGGRTRPLTTLVHKAPRL